MKLKWTDYLYFPWTIWSYVVAITIAILMFPFLFIGIRFGNEKVHYYTHFLPDIAAKIILFFCCIRIKVHGLENFDHRAQYVFVGNHRSYLDALISASCIPNYKKYIGRAELLKFPIIGYILRKMYIPVQRDDKDSRKWSMEQLFAKTSDGASMVIYPEGTTNPSAEYFLPFKDGAFRLSIGAQIPIVAMTCIGAGELWHRKSMHIIKPGKLLVFFSSPFSPAGKTEVDVEAYKASIKAEFMSHLQVYYPHGYV